jgi:hypothetical protein
MGWTAGALSQPFTALAAIEFDLGEEFATRVIDTARYGTVIYAAVRSRENQEIWGLVLLAERRDGLLYTKPISEDMGPVEDRCPARILDLLTAPSNEYARKWRARCRAHLARPRPRPGQTVVFAKPLLFTNDAEHDTLVFDGGSRFHCADGRLYRVASWRQLEYTVLLNGGSRTS